MFCNMCWANPIQMLWKDLKQAVQNDEATQNFCIQLGAIQVPAKNHTNLDEMMIKKIL